MGQESCFCGTGGIGNLGLPVCNDLLKVVSRVAITNTYDGEGNRNAILISDLVDGVLPDGYFNDKLIDPDASKRIFITAKTFDEVEITNTDRTTQTTDSGAIYELLQGVIQFTGKLYKFPPAYSGQLNSTSCGENSVYFIDTEGRIMGEISSDGTKLYPLELQEGSLVSQWYPTSTSSASYVDLMFQLDRVVSSENFLTIPPQNITENLRKAESLIDVTLVDNGSTVASLVYDANYSLYGVFGNKGTLEGKVGIEATDAKYFTIQKDGIDVSIASVTEVDGLYTVTPTAPFTIADVITVKYKEVRTTATAKGFESNTLSITIPA